jgi:hypothetical protein
MVILKKYCADLVSFFKRNTNSKFIYKGETHQFRVNV